MQREIRQLSSPQQPDTSNSYSRSFPSPPQPRSHPSPGGSLSRILEAGAEAAWAGFQDCRKHPLGALELVLEAVLPAELFAWTEPGDLRCDLSMPGYA